MFPKSFNLGTHTNKAGKLTAAFLISCSIDLKSKGKAALKLVFILLRYKCTVLSICLFVCISEFA